MDRHLPMHGRRMVPLFIEGFLSGGARELGLAVNNKTSAPCCMTQPTELWRARGWTNGKPGGKSIDIDGSCGQSKPGFREAAPTPATDARALTDAVGHLRAERPAQLDTRSLAAHVVDVLSGSLVFT